MKLYDYNMSITFFADSEEDVMNKAHELANEIEIRRSDIYRVLLDTVEERIEEDY